MRFYAGAKPTDVPNLTDPWDQAPAYYVGPTPTAGAKGLEGPGHGRLDRVKLARATLASSRRDSRWTPTSMPRCSRVPPSKDI